MTRKMAFGWHQMMTAAEALAEAENEHDKKAISDGQLLHRLTYGVRQHGGGVRECLQELYERMERLHQKIDRIEAKIGSVPKR